jgi:hypothetical protein
LPRAEGTVTHSDLVGKEKKERKLKVKWGGWGERERERERETRKAMVVMGPSSPEGQIHQNANEHGHFLGSLLHFGANCTNLR